MDAKKLEDVGFGRDEINKLNLAVIEFTGVRSRDDFLVYIYIYICVNDINAIKDKLII